MRAEKLESNIFYSHVCHHLYLQILDQLHLALVHLRHRHLHCFFFNFVINKLN